MLPKSLRKQNPARWVGYATASLLILITLSILYTLGQDVARGPHLVRVRFPTVGTLMQEDPVTRKGVVIGRVHSLTRDDSGAIVTLELFHREPLPAHMRFVSFSHSLFGARMILAVEEGFSEAPMDENQIQKGYFTSGLTDVIHRVGDLLSMVQNYQRVVVQLRDGHEKSPSIRQLLEQDLYPALQQLHRLNALTQELEHTIQQQSEWVLASRQKAQKFATLLRQESGNSVVTLDSALQQWQKLSLESNQQLHKLSALTQEITQPDHPLQKILLDPKAFEQLRELVHSIEALNRLLSSEGLSGVIHFWKNVHILGTSPTKRKP